MAIERKKYEGFTVHIDEECSSFVHVDIENPVVFYENIFRHFFDETRLLRYAENKASVSFSPTSANYATLYRKLTVFLDKENEIDLPLSLEKEVIDAICDEYEVVEERGLKKIRLDKMGKIGEYIFGTLLSDYFKFECVIPKLNLITDRNMSVYGIDSVYYSPHEKLVLLGESKVSKSLENGISMINSSLASYQQQVDDEFTLMLSQRWLRDKMGSFGLDFEEQLETSIKMSDFVNKAKIETIGIPIVIAHGGDVDVGDIFEKMKKIKKISLYGLKTEYIIISMPLIDKKAVMECFAKMLVERRRAYEDATR